MFFMEKCPKCGNYKGPAFPESVIETVCGTIHYQRCNGCDFVSIDIDELVRVVSDLKSRIEELESKNDNLNEEKDALESEVSNLRSQLPAIDDDEIPNPEPSFNSPR